MNAIAGSAMTYMETLKSIAVDLSDINNRCIFLFQEVELLKQKIDRDHPLNDFLDAVLSELDDAAWEANSAARYAAAIVKGV